MLPDDDGSDRNQHKDRVFLPFCRMFRGKRDMLAMKQQQRGSARTSCDSCGGGGEHSTPSQRRTSPTHVNPFDNESNDLSSSSSSSSTCHIPEQVLNLFVYLAQMGVNSNDLFRRPGNITQIKVCPHLLLHMCYLLSSGIFILLGMAIRADVS